MRYTLHALLMVVFFTLAVIAENKVKNTIIDNVLQISKCEVPPSIDGDLDGVWHYVTATPLLKFEDGVGVHNDFADHFTNFRVMWDDDYFYVFVQVVDDTILTTQGADPWMKDCIELFFDGNNAKLYQQYDANDVQWRYVAMENWQSPTKTGNGKGEYAWKRTVNGYNLELRIPKDSLTFPLQADHVLGFEISNADRDNDIQARTHVLHWWAIDGNTWRWANLFGTAKLVGGPTAVEQGTLANEFRLEQNYPNPFNPETRIVYSLPERAHVRLSVYNILGQEVALLVNNVLEQGTYTAHFNAKGYPSGVYIYKLQTQGTSIVRKMLLIK
ncbi:MAG: T9SS type A sorting domain-containing protein [Bacteroidetes bacterium]|nr:T9SS type A sorting domain-containing protein [Bacteroidota bacterium]